MRGRQGSFHSTCPPYGEAESRLKNADTCKEETPCLHISKWDIRLILALVHSAKKTTSQVWTQEPAQSACMVEASPVPQPIIVREADAVLGLDESLSCHVSVSHFYCGKANYRWLNAPLFSAFWCTARPYTELKGRNTVCQMEAATNCSAQIPPFFFGRPRATHHF